MSLSKWGKFYFLADFLVLEMERQNEISIILGRPFLAIGKAMIDVQRDRLTFRVGKDIQEFNYYRLTFRVGKDIQEFNYYRALKYPTIEDCLKVHMLEDLCDNLG